MIDIEVPQHVRYALNQARWRALGRFEALEKVADRQLSLNDIRAGIKELEEELTNPQRVHGSMARGTSVRLCAEGHWAGLRAALEIMTGGELD